MMYYNGNKELYDKEQQELLCLISKYEDTILYKKEQFDLLKDITSKIALRDSIDNSSEQKTSLYKWLRYYDIDHKYLDGVTDEYGWTGMVLNNSLSEVDTKNLELDRLIKTRNDIVKKIDELMDSVKDLDEKIYILCAEID